MMVTFNLATFHVTDRACSKSCSLLRPKRREEQEGEAVMGLVCCRAEGSLKCV